MGYNLMLELGIPTPKSALRGAIGKTFLDKIYENDRKVEITNDDYRQLLENLPICWGNEHSERRLPFDWKKAYES